MKELTKKIREFSEQRDWNKFHTPENLVKTICIESSELLECFQWNNEYNINSVKEEIADVMNNCIRLCDVLSLDPKQIMLEKIEKNALKYPVDKCKGKCTKYKDL